jgi:hypothetical protein
MDLKEFEKWWMRQPSMGSEIVAAREAWEAATKLAEKKLHLKSEMSDSDEVVLV